MPSASSQLLINMFDDELRHWQAPGTLKHRIGPVGLQGVLTRPVLIDSAQKRDICGVDFFPSGASAFHTNPATEFTDLIVAGESVYGEDVRDMLLQLHRIAEPTCRLDVIETFLLRRLVRRPGEDELLENITNQIRSGATITEIRRTLGLSQRRLHALFDRRIGVRPKLFARLERFSAVLRAMSDPNSTSWSDLAIAEGFADQAHLIRDFQALSTTLPSLHSMVEGEVMHADPLADKIFNTDGVD